MAAEGRCETIELFYEEQYVLDRHTGPTVINVCLRVGFASMSVISTMLAGAGSSTGIKLLGEGSKYLLQDESSEDGRERTALVGPSSMACVCQLPSVIL